VFVDVSDCNKSIVQVGSWLKEQRVDMRYLLRSVDASLYTAVQE